MRILCATDLLPKSEGAIERAGLLADQLSADLTLLHVVVPGDSERTLEQTLQTALARTKSRAQRPLWRAQRKPNVAVRAGYPGRVIVDTVAQSRARLLVVGPRSKRPLRDALEGAIAEKALSARNTAVLVVQGEVRGPYRRVLLALDLSEPSVSAIRAAESLVLTPEVDARIVHASEPPYQGMLHYAGVGMDSAARYAEGWRREVTRAVRELLEYESAHSARYDIHIQHQPAAVGILREMEHYKPDLLVMGTHGGGRLRRALVGSIASRVLHETTCDVLIVPEGSFGASRSKSVFGERRLHDVSHESRNAPAQLRAGAGAVRL